jgi:phosphoserine phosphatase
MASNQAKKQTKVKEIDSMATNYEYLKDGFEMWQGYVGAYTDFVVEATQRTVEQSVASYERVHQVMADAVKKTQVLNAQGQEVALGAAEVFYAQAQSTSERVAKMVTRI